jgi:hypothetical protein
VDEFLPFQLEVFNDLYINHIILNLYYLKKKDGSHVIELGAQWIHGEKKNPIHDLCTKIGIVDNGTNSKHFPKKPPLKHQL